MCLLALAVTVKPLANVVGNYARYDGHKKCDDSIHDTHLLPITGMEKGSGASIAQASECWQGVQGQRPGTFTLRSKV